jgi:hypothetical protein
VDPLVHKYPFYSPYHFSSNSPIISVELEGLESSTLVNENEKQKAIKEHGVVSTWVGLRLLDFAELFINVGRISEGKPVLKYPILQGNPEENIESLKSVANTTFEVMSILQTAKFGIGGEDNAVSFKNPFKFFTKPRSLQSITEIRINLAKSFFSKFGVSNIDRHIEAINFEKPVYTQLLEAGTKLFRYSKKGTTDPKHYFFTEKFTLPGAVGKVSAMNNPQNYIIEEFTLTKSVKVLKSTTDLAGKPAGNQIFSTEIQKSSTLKSANTWTDLITD